VVPKWAYSAVAGTTAPPDVVHVTGGSIDAAIRAAVDRLGGISQFVRRGQKVVISPNVGFPNPAEMATTTDPAVVRVIATLCKEAGASSVTIANYPVRDPELCFERSGIGELARMNGVDVVPLNSGSPYTSVRIPGGVDVSEVEVATIVRQADVLIAVPVAKSHSSAGVSFAMKGMMGLIRSRGLFHARYDLHQAVADLSRVVKAQLVIVDARRALVTRGPGGPGRVELPNAIVAGRSQISVDAYSVGLAQWYNRSVTASQVRHIRLAGEQGLGVIDVSAMKVAKVTL
jgi:uncharacterized protein (DUF362 family)